MKRHERIHALVLRGAAVLLGAFAVLGPSSPGLATEFSIGNGKGASLPPRAMPRKKHKGKQGKEQACYDDNTKVRILEVPATLSADRKSVSWRPDKGQLEDVYEAAFDECFLEDHDDLPEFGSGAPLHDARNYTIGGKTVTLLLRPASNAALVQFKNKKKPKKNHGFIAAEVFNTSTTETFYTPGLQGVILPLHSAFFWLGRDENGMPYAMFVDLKSFPDKTKPDTKDDFLVMHAGGLDVADKPQYKTDIGIARWDHTHIQAGHNHSGSWVDCDPGCCMSSAEVLYFSPLADRVKPYEKMAAPVRTPARSKMP